MTKVAQKLIQTICRAGVKSIIYGRDMDKLQIYIDKLNQ